LIATEPIAEIRSTTNNRNPSPRIVDHPPTSPPSIHCSDGLPDLHDSNPPGITKASQEPTIAICSDLSSLQTHLIALSPSAGTSS
jgi:hypothetical protein